ncbi:MAG: hypothetical protein MI802_28705 [Desulfobacterales bacterium]|nr:hypothetical protein [Desulfobacterales bacterium]
MVYYIDVHTTDKKTIDELIASLEPCKGVCLFIDIANSSQIKYEKGYKEWILLLKNTFGVLQLQPKLKNNIVKFIGDAIMVFIPEEQIFSHTESIVNYSTLLEEVYATIDMLQMLHARGLYMKCKVSLHHCDQAYNITFFKNRNDYYGIDIDLAARLLQKGKENYIVLSEVFYKKVLRDLEAGNQPSDTRCLKNISPIYVEDFKGIPHSTEFRLIQTFSDSFEK